MFEPELIYHDGDYGIFFQKGIFCNGFNVYKKDSTHWNKLHDELSCFLNIDGAKKFLEKIKAEDLK